MELTFKLWVFFACIAIVCVAVSASYIVAGRYYGIEVQLSPGEPRPIPRLHRAEPRRIRAEPTTIPRLTRGLATGEFSAHTRLQGLGPQLAVLMNHRKREARGDTAAARQGIRNRRCHGI